MTQPNLVYEWLQWLNEGRRAIHHGDVMVDAIRRRSRSMTDDERKQLQNELFRLVETDDPAWRGVAAETLELEWPEECATRYAEMLAKSSRPMRHDREFHVLSFLLSQGYQPVYHHAVEFADRMERPFRLGFVPNFCRFDLDACLDRLVPEVIESLRKDHGNPETIAGMIARGLGRTNPHDLVEFASRLSEADRPSARQICEYIASELVDMRDSLSLNPNDLDLLQARIRTAARI